MGGSKTTRMMRRRVAVKPPRLRILIVSEGAKTEALYFSLLVKNLSLTSVRAEILGKECGSDPLSVVEFAKKRFSQDVGYDLCYCVIDRDSHAIARFRAANELARSVNARSGRREFLIMVSDPCIEFWFILHFTFWRAPFSSKGNRSKADCVIDKLKEHLPHYNKVDADQMSSLIPLTSIAITNAVKVWEDVESTGEPNPSTQVHVIVTRLQKEAAKG